jgi:copper resistance protein B
MQPNRIAENETMLHTPWKRIAVVLAFGMVSVAQAQTPMENMNHEGMNHGAAPAVDHAAMGHGAMPGMETPAAEGGSMNHGSMQGGPAPSDARDPHAYADGYDFGPIMPPMHAEGHSFGSLLLDRFERARTRDSTSTEYDLNAWYGGDYDRAVLKAEGDYDGGRLHDARTDLLWGHAVSAYWDTQLGVRYDSGLKPDRRWLAFGIQGLAPYWFEVEATAYVGEQGRTAFRFAAEYELLLTQKLILQPRIEANFYGKRDVERELGSGLSDLAAGVRLRYEICRELAPYVGIERAGKFGATADHARTAGEDAKETRLVAGVRFWF